MINETVIIIKDGNVESVFFADNPDSKEWVEINAEDWNTEDVHLVATGSPEGRTASSMSALPVYTR